MPRLRTSGWVEQVGTERRSTVPRPVGLGRGRIQEEGPPFPMWKDEQACEGTGLAEIQGGAVGRRPAQCLGDIHLLPGLQ